MSSESGEQQNNQEPKRTPRIALAHDWLVGLRGGELVLDRLARLYGPTDLYTLVNDNRPLTRPIDECRVVNSPLQRLPGARGKLRRLYLPLMPWAVERLRVSSCDLLISTSSAVMKSIKPPRGTAHLCYCHSPARYLWDQTDDYARGGGMGGRLRGLALRTYQKRFQRWDRTTADRVTTFLANSKHTAKRIKRCYDREAIVVYPPVRTEFFTPDSAIPREHWYLIVSALEPYKRVDMAIRAANRAGFKLKIAGSGSQMKALHRLAGPTVEFLGRVVDEPLRDLYRQARAFLFPQVEDFGITAVEAQASGCPVIAFAGGGALETVTADTGVFFSRQTAGDLIDAVRQFEGKQISLDECRQNAVQFSEEVFDRAIQKQVDTLLR